MYKVIKFFTDLHDNNFAYNMGDIFPRSGIKVSEGRLAELAGSDNKQGEPLIEKVEPSIKNPEKKPAAKKATKKTAAE